MKNSDIKKIENKGYERPYGKYGKRVASKTTRRILKIFDKILDKIENR